MIELSSRVLITAENVTFVEWDWSTDTALPRLVFGLSSGGNLVFHPTEIAFPDVESINLEKTMNRVLKSVSRWLSEGEVPWYGVSTDDHLTLNMKRLLGTCMVRKES